MSISIIVPIYNEAECIERCLEATRDAFQDTDYEIIVVNDGSTDLSDRIVRGRLAGSTWLRYISSTENRGYSHAIRQGIRAACKEYTSYLDADLQYPADQLRRMYEVARNENALFVLGRPDRKYYNPYRQLQSYVYNVLVRRLLRLDVMDANSLKVIRTETLKVLPLFRERGAIELEVLVGIANQSIVIRQVPIRVQRRIAGRSKSGWMLIVPTLKTILELRRLRAPTGAGKSKTLPARTRGTASHDAESFP